MSCGQFLEDFGEKAGPGLRPTPEQCLAYFAFEPEGHRDIGLIVIDECHQLCEVWPGSSSTGSPSSRAMWTCLAQRSPEADILISAMVRNGAELPLAGGCDWRPAKVLDLEWKPTQVRGVVAYRRNQFA
jgi:hypothetical protein